MPRIYPAPAPTAIDTARGPAAVQDLQQFANPAVLGMGPSKGLLFRYERMPSFSSSSTGQVAGVGDYSTEATKKLRISARGFIPVWNRPHFKVILGLSYDREEFRFRDEPTNYQLLDNIESKGLKSTGAQLVIIRPVDAVHWYLVRVRGELAGDYESESDLTATNYLRASTEAFYGWKRSPRFSWGVGFQYGYTFGRLTFIPAIIYNRTFNDHWGLEAVFPARVLLRYNASAKSIFYTGYSVAGFNYILNTRQPLTRPDRLPLNTLELRQTELRFRLRWDHELLSFLWIGAEAGFRHNLSFDAFDRINAERKRIISTELGGAPYVGVELFAVPPRKLLAKAGLRR